jgi:hypothetical protein
MITKIAIAGAATALMLGGIAVAQVAQTSQPGPVTPQTGTSANTTGSMQTSTNNPEQGVPATDAVTAGGQTSPATTDDVSVTPANGSGMTTSSTTTEPAITTTNSQTGYAGGYTGPGSDAGYSYSDTSSSGSSTAGERG